MRAEDNIPELKFDNLSIERNSFADAYFIAHSTISPIYLPIVKAGICVSLAVLSASVLPLYRTFFSGVVVPVIAISFFILLALFFMVVWPGIIKGRGAKIFSKVFLKYKTKKKSLENIGQKWTVVWKQKACLLF